MPVNQSLLFPILFFNLVSAHSIFKFGDDAQQFSLKWNARSVANTKHLEVVPLVTPLKEKYECLIPEIGHVDPYEGPPIVDFLQYLFDQNTCVYRFDPYWTYEVCHGRYARKYHESPFALRKYTLGQWSSESMRDLKTSRSKLPRRNIFNQLVPYVEIQMENGSSCPSNDGKMECKIIYICNLNSNIYSVTETQTCVYEIIVLTPILCAHPHYRQNYVKNVIHCYPLDKSPKIPYQLSLIRRKVRSPELIADPKERQIVDDFIAGRNCIEGGHARWKYEFCFQRHVKVYEGRSGVFGTRKIARSAAFEPARHLDWIRDRPYKRPKPKRMRAYINQFYWGSDNGTRNAEVKLKCLESSTIGFNSMAIYVYETSASFVLGVEAAFLCRVVKLADKYGVVTV